jgi:hypothetical protein
VHLARLTFQSIAPFGPFSKEACPGGIRSDSPRLAWGHRISHLSYRHAAPYQQAATSRMGTSEGRYPILDCQQFMARCGRDDGKGAQLCCHVRFIPKRPIIHVLIALLRPDHYDAQMRAWGVHKNLKSHEWRGSMQQLDSLAARHQRKVRMRILGKVVPEDRLRRSRSRHSHSNSGMSRADVIGQPLY